MAKRLNTIIIVPHSKAKFIKFSFSTKAFVVLGCCVAVAAALSLFAIVYTSSAVNRRAEVQRLTRENRQLAEVNLSLEETIAEVQGRLDEFEERTARLALAAGMETAAAQGTSDQGRSGRMGSGGLYDRLPESPERLSLQGSWIEQRLAQVEESLLKRDQLLACTPSVAPVAGLITDGFGRRKDPFTGRQAFHPGLDLSARRGTPVVATADGIVVFAGRNGGLGKVIRISHGFGYTTVYGHLDKILVEPGDEVRRGEQVGLLGNTGRSTGPHLHYEVHEDGRAVNPLYHILGTG
jgi:murein DD-endopeptidase MepM/ murein hydrolase activator NlpD